MNQPLVEFTGIDASDPFEMRKAFRLLVEASGMSRRKIDEVAGLPIGYTDKLLCEPPVRNIGPTSFFPLLWALSHKIRFIPDPHAKRKIEAHHMFQTRDERARRGDDHWRNAKALGIVREKGKETGFLGGKARFAKMTPKQLKHHQRKAANARWRAHRRRLRLLAQESACFASLDS